MILRGIQPSRVLGSGSLVHKAAFPTQGLVFYAPLWSNLCTGSPFRTLDNNGHPCTVTEAVWGSTGRLFDGVNDLINCGSASTLDNVLDGGGTLEAWVNPSSDGELDAGRVLSKAEWYLRFTSEVASKVKVDFIVNWDGTPSYKQWVTTATEVDIGSFAHVAVTHNCDANTNEAIIYVNGTVVTAPGTADPGGTRDSDAALDFIIGNHSNGAATLDGYVGEVRIYNRVLSASEILNIYNITKWRYS